MQHSNINQSLLTLGRVITALTEGHSHIPVRPASIQLMHSDGRHI